MIEATYTFATAAEIRAIFDRAFTALDSLGEDDDDDDTDHLDRTRIVRENLRHEAAIAALRFGSLAAGQLGDASLLPLIVQAIEVVDHYDHHADDHPTTLGSALAQLLARGVTLDESAKELVSHRNPDIRAAMAASLLPRGEVEMALLQTLATDTIAEVRNAAKKTLQTVRDVPWWTGKFSSDPTARLTPEEALAHKPTFERISTILDQHRYTLAKSEQELAELAASLPHEIAVDLAVGVLEIREPYQKEYAHLCMMLMTREGGEAAFIRLCKRWNEGESRSYLQGEHLGAVVRRLPAAIATALCMRFAAEACSVLPHERSMQQGNGARHLAEIAGHGFPPGQDVSPLLDLVLALPPLETNSIDWVAHGLAEAFGAEGADTRTVIDRVFEARLAGYPGPWKPLWRALDILLTRTPGAILRPIAERAIASDDDGVATWGLEKILGSAHDPDRDPPAPDLLARFFTEPRYRRLLLASSLSSRTLPILRAALREGRLEMKDIVTTMRHIGTLYGGVAPRNGHYGLRPDSPEMQEAARVKERDALGVFLGPEALRGPPTQEEWAEVRAARKRRLEAPDAKPGTLLEVLPDGPWAPDDRAFFERCWELVREAEGDGHEATDLAAALSGKPDRDLFAHFPALLARAPAHCRGMIHIYRRSAADQLGIESPRVAEATSDEKAEEKDDDDRQWMDEPDE